MGRNSIWTKEEDAALQELATIYGQNRPSDICHQLKKIYGIQKLPRQITNRLRLVNPGLKQSYFSAQEYSQAWHLIKAHCFDWNKVAQLTK